MLPPKCRVFFAKEVGGCLIERYAYVLDSDGVSDPGLLLQVARNVGNERFFGHAIPSVLRFEYEKDAVMGGCQN